MHRILVRMAVVAGLVACGVFLGCEDSPDKDNVDAYFEGSNVDSAADRPAVNAPRMLVTPAATMVATNGVIARFTVEGEAGTALWSVQDPLTGRILTQASTSATYQRLTAGDNVVIVTDSNGNAAFAVVSQP